MIRPVRGKKPHQTARQKRKIRERQCTALVGKDKSGNRDYTCTYCGNNEENTCMHARTHAYLGGKNDRNNNDNHAVRVDNKTQEMKRQAQESRKTCRRATRLANENMNRTRKSGAITHAHTRQKNCNTKQTGTYE